MVHQQLWAGCNFSVRAARHDGGARITAPFCTHVVANLWSLYRTGSNGVALRNLLLVSALFFAAPVASFPQAPGEVRTPQLLDVSSFLRELIYDEALGLRHV